MSKRRFQIPTYKHPTQIDNSNAECIWQALSHAIDEIYRKNAIRLSFEELYRAAYNLVLHKHGDKLYDGVEQTIRMHLQDCVTSISSSSNERFLENLATLWFEHKTTLNLIKDILMYMDRTYVPQQKKLSVLSLGLKIFREVVIYHASVRSRLRRILLENIQSERNGQTIDKSLMRNIIYMLVEISSDGVPVYHEDFELHLLDQTRLYYKQEASRLFSCCSCGEYLMRVEERIREEGQRLLDYLIKSSEGHLFAALDHELLVHNANALIYMENSGFVSMIKDDKFDDLIRMYQLFSRIAGALELMMVCLGQYIDTVGVDICSSTGASGTNNSEESTTASDPVSFVTRMLALHGKLTKIIDLCFKGDKKFHKKMKEMFEQLIGSCGSSPYFLASYCDCLLKNASHDGINNSSKDGESKFDDVIVIFRFIHDKDMFENYYKSFLSKRLLTLRSVSDDGERQIMSMLKAECGCHFTSKMEGMFSDVKLSSSIMDAYKSSTMMSSNRLMDLDVNVLTQGYWPFSASNSIHCALVTSSRYRETLASSSSSSSSSGRVILPLNLLEVVNSFENSYFKEHSGRNLNWLMNMGTGEVRWNCKDSKKELIVSTYQMIILVLFNETDFWTLANISTRTGICESELKRHLLSLCTAKIRILTKRSKGRGVEDDDAFTLNHGFTSKLRRIRIPLISMKDILTDASSSSSHSRQMDEDGVPRNVTIPCEAVEEDRRHMIEASIVRIMKARKTSSHNDLVAEVCRQLSNRFVPSPPDVKRRIESLLERDYLERDTTDRHMYRYIA